jgi:hypothetical protein
MSAAGARGVKSSSWAATPTCILKICEPADALRQCLLATSISWIPPSTPTGIRPTAVQAAGLSLEARFEVTTGRRAGTEEDRPHHHVVEPQARLLPGLSCAPTLGHTPFETDAYYHCDADNDGRMIPNLSRARFGARHGFIESVRLQRARGSEWRGAG